MLGEEGCKEVKNFSKDCSPMEVRKRFKEVESSACTVLASGIYYFKTLILAYESASEIRLWKYSKSLISNPSP